MPGAWLLRPGDPLPPLCLKSGPWTAEAFAGHWGVVVVADGLHGADLTAVPAAVRVLGIGSPGRTAAAGAVADDGTVSAQRLGALVAADCVVPVAVVLDPGGTVAFAAQGDSASAAVGLAVAWLGPRLGSPTQP